MIKKDWVEFPPHSQGYKDGVNYFLDIAFTKGMVEEEEILCPCVVCCNDSWKVKDVAYDHLCSKEFVKGYTKWIYHGINEDFEKDDINDEIQEDGVDAGFQEDVIGDEFQEDDIDLYDEFEEDGVDGEFQKDDIDEEYLEDDICDEFQEEDLDDVFQEDKLE
ncbi:unnamed protein product [Vicia faba]|uniref:Transposase-associated domain-containing protein n=1 Tax=Vicia faba TaxID=3906 RepID=A0AAV0ZS61_VICFA|nr:unnamed protein product [Vicia faba]